MIDEQCKLWSSSLWSFPHPSVTPSIFHTSFPPLTHKIMYVSCFLGSRVEPSLLSLRPLHCLFYQPRMTDDNECRVVGGMLSWGNRSTRRNSAPAPLCSPQIQQ
jgi:hypothetical protein